MSRSKKGGKGCGFEYWTKRAGNKDCPPPGKYSKKRTHKLERLEDKKLVKEEKEKL